MKSVKNQFYKHLTFSKLLEAEIRAAKNKKTRSDVRFFEEHLEKNILTLMDSISNHTYKLGDYTAFTIYEPKKRVIRKLPFVDRIVHQWYVEEFIKTNFVKSFIYDSYACLNNKGVLKAIRRVQYFFRKNKDSYILKMDVSKYFDSIDKNLLMKILSKKIKDRYLLSFTRQIIYDNCYSSGLPIGNYTSQFFGNIYLNELDHYLKYKLHIKYYVRYLDDFVIFVSNRNQAKQLYKLIELFLNENLHLKLNPKSTYNYSSKGVLFCGYKIYPDYLLVNRSMIKKLKKKLKTWKYDRVLYYKSLPSYLGYLSHSASKSMIALLKSLTE
ncbi:MAG: reverse transcriptase/maturase family protein [Bacilli bacterium]